MASRIQNKRSSFKGKRPNNANLEPGEIALNTNADDAGLFFEANDGSVVKAGPTFIGIEPPETNGVEYWNGEQWYDQGNATLNFFSKIRDEWVPSLSPFFGGSKTAIFVGTEFPEATDDLSNDGIARPFATINRACIEVARRSILRNRTDDPLNNRFSIILLPGRNVVHNEPGLDADTYIENIEKFTKDQAITSDNLALLNPVAGGLPLPRGTSMIGLDLRKTTVVPTYYPKWDRETYFDSPEDIESRTAILKWTGNSFLTAMTFFDKVSEISVESISEDPALNGVAILKSLRPHGLNSYTDEVNLIYPEQVSQTFNGEQTIDPSPPYYAEPIDSYRFYLRKSSATGALVQRSELPEFPAAGTSPSEFARFTINLSTHHRLSAISFISELELNEYYSKVQHAFGNLDFGNTLDNAEVGKGETVIVNPVEPTPVPTIDTTESGSPYAFNMSLRSDYGMCGMTHDGEVVKGFRSALSSNFTCVSLQNDPEVFEVYISTQDRTGWFSLREAAAFAAGVPAGEISNEEAITFLINNVDLQYVRYFYRDAMDVTLGSDPKSSGLPDEKSDARHYHTLCEGAAVTQIALSFAVGPAVNYWARGGGKISISNANSNFGGQALRSEGFTGIGTLTGALPPDQGFTIQGVRTPRLITAAELVNEKNHLQLFLNVGVIALDADNHQIVLDGQVDETVIYPYSLKAGTAIWVRDLSTGLRYSGILENVTGTESPVLANKMRIQLSDQNDNITALTDAAVLSPPYVRRLLDPRTEEERTYSLWIQNTSQDHRPPQASFVLRYSNLPQSGTERLIYPGRQLDPGQGGGWNQTFTVSGAITKEDGDNPNISPNKVIPAKRSADGYYISLRLADSFGPWVGGYELPEDAEAGATVPGVQQYSRGSIATSNSYSFYAQNAEVEVGDLAIDPSAQSPNSWTPTKPYEYGQLTTNALIPAEQHPASADPWTDTYSEEAVYLRGVGVERESYYAFGVIDEDDGSSDLGLGQPGQPYADPQLTDPDYTHSKLAMSRFIHLLGYDQDGVDNLLLPRRATTRNVPVGDAPWPDFVPNEGNAEAEGNWSVEFNQPSSILSTNHTFEWAGYLSYSKGLPSYQKSPLGRRLRFDNILSEVWGGVAVTTGANESNEFIISGFNTVGGNGRPIIDDQPTIGNEGDFVLRAGDNMTGDLTLGDD